MLIFNDVAAAEVATDVAGSPVFGDGLFPAIDGSRFKGFESDIVVEIIVIAQRIEIPATAVDRQVGRPVVGDAGIGNILPHSPGADAVWPAGQRRLRQRVAEFVLAPERLGHNRQAQQTQHVLFAGLAEVNTHGQRRDGLHGGAFIKQAKLRHPFGHKLVEGKRHIAGGDRRTVMEAGARVERDLHPGIVLGIARPLGNQRVVAAGLIIRGGEQGIVERLRAYRGVATQRITVEVIKGADRRQGEGAAFRRPGIDVIKMTETGGVFRFADNREGYAFLNGLRLSVQAKQSQQNQKEARIHRRQNTLSWPAPMADIRSRIISET